MHDAGHGWIEATRADVDDAFRQGRAHEIDLADHLAEFFLRIDAPLELDHDDGQAGARLRTNVANVFDAVDRIFERNGDQPLHLLSISAWQDDSGGDAWKLGDRIFRFRNRQHRANAQRDQQQKQNAGELPAIDEEAGDRLHG